MYDHWTEENPDAYFPRMKAYVAENTRINNELTFKADDGLGSDIQIYLDTDDLKTVIPEKTIQQLKQIDGIGTNGIGVAFVATEVITLIAAWIFRKIKHKNSTFYIVPDQNPGTNLDFSIKSTMEEAGAVNRKILEFCKENGVSGNRANLAAVCAEEMTVNIIKFGGKTSNWIDINLCLEDDICQLRIRDNGVNFNPLEYSYDHEEFDIHGIELVKKISKSMDYIRAIDMLSLIHI